MRLKKITYRDLLLFLEIYFLSAFVRAVILLFPLRKLQFLTGNLINISNQSPHPSVNELTLLRRNLNRVSRFSFWKVNCLVKVIIQRRILKRWGYSPYIQLGCTKPSEELLAHAWISFETSDINGNFKKLASYG